MNKNINFDNAKDIQEFANQNCNGNFTKAVNMLCDASIELNKLAKKHGVKNE